MSAGRVASLLCTLALLLGSAAAHAEVDLAPLRSRVDAAIVEHENEPALRRRYEFLATALAAPDRAGLADDFSKLEAVATACRGALAPDTVLCAALDSAVGDAIAGLEGEETDAARAVADLRSPRSRHRRSADLLRGRERAADAEDRAGSDPESSCRLGRSAASTFARVSASAERALRRSARQRDRWTTVLADRPGALLSVHVTRGLAPDVYVVGASDGTSPTFLRGGPEGFVRIDTTAHGSGDLWWVDEVPGAGVWACGTDGRVLRYDPATGGTADVSTGLAVTLYGLRGFAPDDVWVVGTRVIGGPSPPSLLHWDGVQWTPAVLPAIPEGSVLYKIDGPASGDLLACGSSGLLLRWDGSTWTQVPSGTDTTLLTVVGGDRAVAVGDVLRAAIVERSAAGTWAPVAIPAATRSVAGVRARPSGEAWACGYFGTVLRRGRGDRGRWTLVEDAPIDDGVHLHAVTIDDGGGVWIAGGDIFDGGRGTLLHHGAGAHLAGLPVLPQSRWTGEVQPLLYASCAFTACHVPPFLGAELDLETSEAAARDLARPSMQSPLLRVAPGRPASSYLWHKLNDTQSSVGGSGFRMPQGETGLPAADLAKIRAWILEGALTGE